MEQHCRPFIFKEVGAKNYYKYSHNIFPLKSKTIDIYFIINETKIYYLNVRSVQDQRLYIVKDEEFENNNSAPASIFDQLNLFDNTNDLLKRSVN